MRVQVGCMCEHRLDFCVVGSAQDLYTGPPLVAQFQSQYLIALITPASFSNLTDGRCARIVRKYRLKHKGTVMQREDMCRVPSVDLSKSSTKSHVPLTSQVTPQTVSLEVY